MRPPGEIGQAILQAAERLTTVIDGQRRGPTLQEIQRAACVGTLAARQTVSNLTRAGKLEPVFERKVDYRNRPVKEYAPARRDARENETVDVAGVFALWAQQG
jgi:hypothetical protein